jgi:hypothetical protein
MIHGNNDFILLPPSRYSSGIVHTYLNPDAPVEAAPQWLLDLAFEAEEDDSELRVPRIPPHRVNPESLPGVAKRSAKAESQICGRKGWPAFGPMGWRRKIHFPRRA